jgi:hypothetical protein
MKQAVSQKRSARSAYSPKPSMTRQHQALTRCAASGLDEADANAELSAVRKRFHQFADGLDEHLRDRAERPILQGGDADRLSNVGQFHGQCFKSGMFTRQEEREADDHSEETLRREQLVA